MDAVRLAVHCSGAGPLVNAKIGEAHDLESLASARAAFVRDRTSW